MGLAKLKPYLSVENYLAGENDGAIRHEYIAGEVYAMAGSSDRHNRISFNLAKKIDDKLNPNGSSFIKNNQAANGHAKLLLNPQKF